MASRRNGGVSGATPPGMSVPATAVAGLAAAVLGLGPGPSTEAVGSPPAASSAQATPPAPTERAEIETPQQLRFEAENGVALSVYGQIRVREELRNHLFSPGNPNGANSFDFALLRSRLALEVEVDEHLTAIVEIQDARRFGEEGSTTADTAGVDLKRGAIVWDDLLDRPLRLEVGRFVMAYGDERLIGALEWANPGRSFDGIRASFRPGDASYVDLFGARIRDAAGTDDDQDLLGVYAGTSRLLPESEVEAYALYLRDGIERPGESGRGDTGFATLGARIAGDRGGFDYSGEAAVQVGRVDGDDLSAWGAALVAGYTFADLPATPRLGLELDHATGDADPTDGENGQFQTLFPTNHRHYGYADLVGWSNMRDLKAGLSLRPHEQLMLTGDFHHLELADSAGDWITTNGAVVRPGVPGAPTGLLDELDLVLTWQPRQPLTLQFGWAHVWPGDFIRATGEAPDADFAYAQLWLKF